MRHLKKILVTVCMVCMAVLFMPTASLADTGKPVKGIEEVLINKKVKKLPTKASTKTKVAKKKAKENYTAVKWNGNESYDISYRDGCKTLVRRSVKTITTTKFKKGSRKYTVKKKTYRTVKTYTYRLPSGTLVLGKDVGLKLPKKLVRQFAKDGGCVVLNPYLDVNGWYYPENKEIHLLIATDDVVYHEAGHYFADINHNIDTTKEFQKIFKKEKKNYKWLDKKHATSNAKEFFAGSFEWYFVDKKKLKKTLPKTYRYIDKQVKAYLGEQ